MLKNKGNMFQMIYYPFSVQKLCQMVSNKFINEGIQL
ncbi:unnamed protein product [Paramecium sonneborni]|uniref:Uncharacterized protein n=1 Tax=Paramecium sonneborni TaxID=65129 RepID=A0A8S1N1B9_9CILI|nr:unnamed protein product [Paramecium sonneborni]